MNPFLVDDVVEVIEPEPGGVDEQAHIVTGLIATVVKVLDKRTIVHLEDDPGSREITARMEIIRRIMDPELRKEMLPNSGNNYWWFDRSNYLRLVTRPSVDKVCGIQSGFTEEE